MHSLKAPLYQTEQVRELEQLAQSRFGLGSELLMQRAGKAAFDFLHKRWPQVQRLAVFCGAGNNGGDGYVTALHAHERGLKVVIWQLGDPNRLQDAAKLAYEACASAQMDIRPFHTEADLGHPELLIDAICGIGVKGFLRDETIAAIEKMQRLGVPIFSIDLPTGIEADTGKSLGAAVHATATMTFIGLKIGLLTGQGIAYAGEVAVSDLQLPAELFSYVTPVAEKIQLQHYQHYLKPRARDWHKGLSGHALIIGGDKGFSGAPRMAAEAALRVGAGLVSVACHPDNAAGMNGAYPEIMARGIETGEDLAGLLARADILVIGPGLGQTEWSKMIWESLSSAIELPMVIDADGLNWLAKQGFQNDHWVLTPHPGEAGRLLGISNEEVQQDRLEAAKQIQHRFGGVCVLKGAGTIVDAPNKLPGICDKGNPGMATAGTGDILSGVIGGLLAQGIPLADAASLGVCLHALAGDLAAKEGERGMIATDLLPYIRRLSNHSN